MTETPSPEADPPGDVLPIERLTLLEPRHVQALGERWITTVEGFLGAISSTAGREAMQRLLEMTRDEFEAVLDEARVLVTPEGFDAMTRGTAGGALGARFDDPGGKKDRDCPPPTGEEEEHDD